MGLDSGQCKENIVGRTGDYLRNLKRRQYRWQMNKSYLGRMSMWQAAINDKLLGYIYARSLGVPTPSVLFCDVHGYSALPEAFPLEWGCCFVIKPLYGYNDFGILLIEDGVDRFSGEEVGGRADVLRVIRQRPGYEQRLTQRTIYVETLVRGERAHYAYNETPPGYKFFMFGSRIGSITVLDRVKTPHACMAWVDEDFERVDLHGCACPDPGRCSFRHCDLGEPAVPDQWEQMLALARSLGEAVGVHMRVDLFPSRNGRGQTPGWSAQAPQTKR